ncbi:helix-turn-helix transcriptional regulator [Actinobaculum sp. 352]|uniref:helix-turn-helix domain-containing protein n=1 Tax=Actinobaculum sp. 352 TaxID=2490946 RepID=UPI0013DFC82D|nr:helix-turn-helix transcriptional regulator [Actinobaculum sp. 352]
MTGADLFAIRETMGISKNEAARRLHVTTKTLNDWEHDERPIPDGVAEEITAWEDEWLDMVAARIEDVADIAATGDLQDVDMTLHADWQMHYDEAGMTQREHIAMVQAIRLGLRLEGIPVTTHWARG